MGFFSKIFGSSEHAQQNKALQDAFAMVRKVIEDEEFQLSLSPGLTELLKNAPHLDEIPGAIGAFGFIESNPIPVNGAVGEISYLSKLQTSGGEKLLFHRIGAIRQIDVFEAVTYSGSEWFIFFLDLYHPRKSKKTPTGFSFTNDLAQFSGFNKYCANFPYDFVEQKQSQSESGLSFAYIPISKVQQQLQSKNFTRPVAHKVKLDMILSRLSSRLS
jgi:hypothetical protein